MKPLSAFAVAFLTAASLVGFAADLSMTNTTELFFPHEHVRKFTITEADLPYEKQLLMQEHDAVVFILPQRRPVSVWCYKPDDHFSHPEQTTKSGLKTEWGEKPWIRPRMKYKRIDENSFTGDGLDSYIQMGGVVTTGEKESDYTLYVDRLKINIIEDLSATNALPVRIRVAKTNREPQQ